MQVQERGGLQGLILLGSPAFLKKAAQKTLLPGSISLIRVIHPKIKSFLVLLFKDGLFYQDSHTKNPLRKKGILLMLAICSNDQGCSGTEPASVLAFSSLRNPHMSAFPKVFPVFSLQK